MLSGYIDLPCLSISGSPLICSVPKIAVYSPKGKQPWDDAVTLVLTYAEIPYDLVYDDEVLATIEKPEDILHHF